MNPYIDTNLDPRKQDFLNLLKGDFEELPSIGNILAGLGITEEDFLKPLKDGSLALSIDTDFQIHIKR